MEKKNIDWSSLGFGYVQTDYRYVSKFKDGAWDAGELTTDPNVTLNECAGVFQYAQTVFEGMKAYTTEDGHIVMGFEFTDSVSNLIFATHPDYSAIELQKKREIRKSM